MSWLPIRLSPALRTARPVSLRGHFWQIVVGCMLVSVIVQLPSLRAFGQSPGKATEEPTAVESETAAKNSSAEYHNQRVRGRVLWLAEALEKQFGISSVPEVAENGFAIVTKDGSLLPIVENLRGRAFRKDERLRQMELEMLVRQSERQPFLQILRIFEVKGDARYEVDYWCDVCAIVMYEMGPCSCCQDDNRLRKRLVADLDF